MPSPQIETLQLLGRVTSVEIRSGAIQLALAKKAVDGEPVVQQ